MTHLHCCYLLYAYSQGRSFTYVGYTVNPLRRLDQHNRRIKGGARATAKAQGKWHLACVVYPFESKSKAMSFEKKWKHKTHGLKNRLAKMRQLLHSNLNVVYMNDVIGNPTTETNQHVCTNLEDLKVFMKKQSDEKESANLSIT